VVFRTEEERRGKRENQNPRYKESLDRNEANAFRTLQAAQGMVMAEWSMEQLMISLRR
jgi:hypothetical protein